MPRAPKKTKTEDSTSPSKSQVKSKGKVKSPGLKKRREEWKASLPPKWIPRADYKHPKGTRTIVKTKAAKKYPLNDDEIGTLPYAQFPADNGYTMHLYSETQIMNLAVAKHRKLELDLVIDGLIYHWYSGSFEKGAVFSVSLKNPPKPEPQPWDACPPLKIKDYTLPHKAEFPDPDSIIWTPSKISGPVTVKDACRLYGIEPNDIQDLSAHSPWIDLETVAKRAVTLHGGFYAHNALLSRHRNAEEAALQAIVDRTHRADYGISDFKLSPTTLKQMDEIQKLEEDAWMYEIPGTTSSRPKNRVAVLYPIEKVGMDDYGCMWEWFPLWEDF
ncbi:hypothetical protein R3P38DRAFT_2696886 [Favolaschia claudopus]|uniref:Uncharacterized protein n=1 Tax=Favolaschia claudopus TaxID=2862362 RepID=A0AAW0CFD2_9AGAR